MPAGAALASLTAADLPVRLRLGIAPLAARDLGYPLGIGEAVRSNSAAPSLRSEVVVAEAAAPVLDSLEFHAPAEPLVDTAIG